MARALSRGGAQMEKIPFLDDCDLLTWLSGEEAIIIKKYILKKKFSLLGTNSLNIKKKNPRQ